MIFFNIKQGIKKTKLILDHLKLKKDVANNNSYNYNNNTNNSNHSDNANTDRTEENVIF